MYKYYIPLIALLIALTFQSALSQPVWTKIGQEQFNSVCNIDGKHIAVVSDQGSLLLSSDSGKKWNRINLGYELLSVSFRDTTVGIISTGEGYVLLTFDGGFHWKKTAAPHGVAYADCAFIGTHSIICVGYGGKIALSHDDGATWDIISNTVTDNLNSIAMRTEQIGAIVGAAGKVLITKNGGLNWSESNTATTNDLHRIQYLDDSTLIAVGDLGTCILSENGGNFWKKLQTPITSPETIVDISILNSNSFLLFGANGNYCKTSNNGHSWQLSKASVRSFRSLALTRSSFISGSNGVVVGSQSLVCRTIDSGITWSTQSFIPSDGGYIYKLQFIDSENVVAVGQADLRYTIDLFLKSSDGGATWVASQYNIDSLSQFAYVNPQDLYFKNVKSGFVVGFNGSLVSSSNTGKFWKSIGAFPKPVTIRDIEMVDSLFGFIVTDSLLFHTEDGGANWSYSNIAVKTHLYTNLARCYMVNKKTGFILGQVVDTLIDPVYLYRSSGVFLKTVDSGKTWDTINYNTTTKLYSIAFKNDSEGFAGGEDGLLLSTVDSGNTWHRYIGSLPFVQFQDIKFIDDSIGCIVGGYSTVLYTNNGGKTWKRDSSYLDKPTSASDFRLLFDIAFPNKNTVYICAAGGFITRDISSWRNGGLSTVSQTNSSNSIYSYIGISPNPAHDRMSIRLYGDESLFSQQMSLKIYDIVGKEIIDLTEKMKQQTTTWPAEIFINTLNLPSGVYSIVLTSNNIAKTKNFIVIK